MKFLVTGTAGFIGMHTTKDLLNKGHHVIGVDNLSEYYDITLKMARLELLEAYDNFTFHKEDICNREKLFEIFGEESIDTVINLAAQAGVRYSLEAPQSYIDSNVTGFLNILEACKQFRIERLLYASSSSVYGLNKNIPFKESDQTSKPAALYGATKSTNELMAHSYSHLFGLNTIGMRFFTVYGPWGRPDMALFKFVKAILNDKEIEVYNKGKMRRDFTYIDDIVDAVVKLSTTQSTNSDLYEIYNVGNGSPVDLISYIAMIEKVLNRQAKKKFLGLQPGDIEETCADTTKLSNRIGPSLGTKIDVGIKNFVEWYLAYENKKMEVKSS